MTESTHDPVLPDISVLMPAYNYADFIERAILSALGQDYPADRLSLIVVDDGSTDDTAARVAALASAHRGRITLIRQANAGPSAAINRALAAATGDLIAVLDADDMWLAHKTRRQVETFRNDSELTMVFSDMCVVDGAEQIVRPSQVGNIGAFPRRAFATLLTQNRATQSSLMLRREVAHPLPAGVPYSDWWFALCAAQAGPVAYLPEPLALYREHGSNLTSGVGGSAAVREHLKEVRFQLWALRELDLSALEPAETLMVWRGVETHALGAMQAAGSYFVQLAECSAGTQDRAAGLLAAAEQARANGEPSRCCQLSLAALGWDPFSLGARAALNGAAEAALTQPVPA